MKLSLLFKSLLLPMLSYPISCWGPDVLYKNPHSFYIDVCQWNLLNTTHSLFVITISPRLKLGMHWFRPPTNIFGRIEIVCRNLCEWNLQLIVHIYLFDLNCCCGFDVTFANINSFATMQHDTDIHDYNHPSYNLSLK